MEAGGYQKKSIPPLVNKKLNGNKKSTHEGRYTLVSLVGFTVLYNTKVTSWHSLFAKKTGTSRNTKNAPEANPEAPHVCWLF